MNVLERIDKYNERGLDLKKAEDGIRQAFEGLMIDSALDAVKVASAAMIEFGTGGDIDAVLELTEEMEGYELLSLAKVIVGAEFVDFQIELIKLDYQVKFNQLSLDIEAARQSILTYDVDQKMEDFLEKLDIQD